jgi:hypothetical protein
MKPMNRELKLLLSLGLDYLRWTQLTPMLLTWSFAFFVLVVLIITSFEQQAFSAIEYMMQWLVQLPVVGEYFIARFSAEDTGVKLDMEDLKSYVLRGWFFVSLVLMLVRMALSALFGPFQPWTLKRKILYVGFGCLLFLAGLVCIYLTGSENFNGAMAGWMLNFTAWSLLVFLVSVYCLSISHAIGLIIMALSQRSGSQ